MSNLKMFPLTQIPYAGRDAEARARRLYRTRKDQVQAATLKVIDGSGTYSGQPRCHGWVLTEAAAKAIGDRVVNMPGNTAFHPYDIYRLRG
jgi:hypothetical protein